MKKFIPIMVAVVLVLGLCALPALAKGPNGPAGKSNTAHLYLYEKDPSGSWPIVEDGAWGKMKYNLSGPTFDFVFNGHELEAYEDYSLIYYADPWPGDNPGALIASGTSNEFGDIHLGGSVDLGMDLPCWPDANYCCPGGAKIWLVLSDDYDDVEAEMTGWNPTEYLFEHNLITYDDTGVDCAAGVGRICLDNKNPEGWARIDDSRIGCLCYNLAGEEFEYSFCASGLDASTDYSLIYYADPWPGDNPGALIGIGTSDGAGNIAMSGSEELDMDLPESTADTNYPGAKIWLVPSSDYDAGDMKMSAWNPTNYLYECELISYNDTGV